MSSTLVLNSCLGSLGGSLSLVHLKALGIAFSSIRMQPQLYVRKAEGYEEDIMISVARGTPMMSQKLVNSLSLPACSCGADSNWLCPVAGTLCGARCLCGGLALMMNFTCC